MKDLTRKLNYKLGGIKMMLIGTGGLILNEIQGFIMNEPMTSYENNQLSKGYIIKGIGHVTRNNNLINKGRSYIRKYKSKQEIRWGGIPIKNA